MGFLDKVKNLFTEEVEEAPIKKDVIQVEIPAPTSERKEEKVVTESEVLVKEEKPQTPVFFDDKDFANLERKEEKKAPKLEERYRVKEEDKKIFKPTPIISPVYGVLDKNYHKEDITSKKKPISTTSYYEKTNVTIDDVRKKAFGTLEDELETIIPGDNYEINEEKDAILEVESSHDGMLEDLMDPNYEPRFAARSEEVIEVPAKEDDMFEEMHEELHKEEDNLTESDLFNLIDSMYEKKEDE